MQILYRGLKLVLNHVSIVLHENCYKTITKEVTDKVTVHDGCKESFNEKKISMFIVKCDDCIFHY